MRNKFICLIFSIIIFYSCNNNDNQKGFCECFEIEMKIQSETEGGDPKKVSELEEQRKKYCSQFQNISTEEFYEKIKDCR
jgi:hypothetical protein